jgi:hypothetical protein
MSFDYFLLTVFSRKHAFALDVNRITLLSYETAIYFFLFAAFAFLSV